MPNKPQTRKRVRQSEKQRAHNRQIRSSVRTAIKKAQKSVETKAETLTQDVRDAQAKVAKAAKTKLIKKNTMSRIQSRLMKKAAAAAKKAE